MLKPYISPNQKDWDRALIWATYNYNITPHSTTSYAPYEIVYGRSPRLPLNQLIEKTFDNVPITHDYMERLKDSIKHLTTIIQEVAEEAQNQQKHYYDQAHRPHSFKIGDHVTLKIVTLPGHVKKLTPKAKGPFIIKQFVYDEDEQQQAIII